jgi:hypothetical protein
MAKAAAKTPVDFIIDRTLLVGLLCVATSYIVRDTWPAMFFEASALLIGIMWCYRVITTHPDRIFRLCAALVLVLIWSLMAFYLGAAKGVL